MGVCEVRAGVAGFVGFVGRCLGEGRVGVGGGLEIEHGRERLQFDLDSLRTVLGAGLGLGDDDRDRLAGVQDLGLGQWLVGPAGAGGLDREVLSGQDGRDAGGCFRRLGADRRDQRVRLVGEDEPRMEQPRNGEIGGEPRLPADLRLGVTPGCRDADRGHDFNVAVGPRCGPRRLSRGRT